MSLDVFIKKKKDEIEYRLLSLRGKREYSSFDRGKYFQISLSHPFRGTKFQFRYINHVRIQLDKRSLKF